MERYRVSWINGPDGRVLDSHTYDCRDDAETLLKTWFPLVGEDQLLVFEVEHVSG